MPTVNLTTSNNQITGQNLTASGSGTSWTITSASGSSNAVTISESSASVDINHTSRTPGQSVTISPTSSTGNYSVAFSQTVTTGSKGNQTTTVYTAQVQGTVSGAASPSYSLGTVNNMNEGVSQTVTVTTSNVSNGTTLYFSIDGNPSSDFSATSGSFTISGNSGSFTLTTIADQTTENTEVFALRVRTGSTSGTTVASTTFAVINTSSTPTYSLSTPSTMGEGASQVVGVTTTNVGNATLYYTLSPSADFQPSSGSVSVVSNSGSITINSVADNLTEGAETATLRLRTGSTSGSVVDTETFSISDTSTAGGGGGSSGGTGAGTGTDDYGIEIFGPNGSSVILGNNLRTQSIVYFATQVMNNGQTYNFPPSQSGIPNANDSNKVQIVADFGYAIGGSPDTGSQIVITRYSNYFSVRQNTGSQRTGTIAAIRIA